MVVNAMPLGKVWLERLIQADIARTEFCREALENILRFHGEAAVDANGQEMPSSHKLASSMKTRIASIIRSKVDSRFRALEGTDESNAKASQTLANWTLYVNRLKEKQFEQVWNGIIPGCGISYLQWKFPVTGTEKGIEENAEVTVEGGSKRQTKPIDPAIVAKLFPSELGLVDCAQLYMIEWINFLLDPQAVGHDALYKARWTAHRYWKTKREFLDGQNAGFYNKAVEFTYNSDLPTSKIYLQTAIAQAMEHAELHEGDPGQEDPEDGKLWEAWEIHDRLEGTVLHVMPGTDEPIRDPIPDTLGMPYQDFRPDQTPDRFWPKTTMRKAEESQKMLDQAINDLVQHISRLAKAPIPIPSSAPPDLETKIAEAETGEFVRLPDDMVQQGVKAIEIAPMNPASINLIPRLDQNVTEASQISEVSSGVLTRPETTATESAISTNFQNLRADVDRLWFESWLRQVVKRVDFLNQKFFTQAQAIPILGLSTQHFRAPSEEGVMTVTPDSIKGTFDYEITVGEGAERIRAEEKKLALDLTAVAVPFIQSGLIDPIAYWTWLMHRFDMDPSVMIRKGAGMAQVPPATGQTPSVGRGPSEGNAPTAPEAPQGPNGARDMARRGHPSQAAEMSAAMRG